MMRPLLALTALLILTGCPPTKTSPAENARPRETPRTKLQPGAQIDYTGVWSTADDQGQAFDIVIFPNGQAVSNWTKGTEGAKGERGFWRQENGRLAIFFDDGWTDFIGRTESGFLHRGFAPGSSLDGQPANEAAATKIDGPQAPFIGIWRMNKEPDGSYLYIALQSGGRALSTINGGTEGKWEHADGAARCTWPDGWVDVIERAPEGWQKRSWVGTDSSALADLAPATRVGETRFLITP